MLTYNLFNKILIEPAATKPVTRLQITSGFASPDIAKKHMEQLTKLNRPIHIELIVGMPKEFLDEKQHREFCELMKNTDTNVTISCKYIVGKTEVHAKTYCWLFADGKPFIAFAGSANYTMTAFGMSRNSERKEVMTWIDAPRAKKFHDILRRNTIDCTSPGAFDYIKRTTSKTSPYQRYRYRYRPYTRRRKDKESGCLVLVIAVILFILYTTFFR